MPLRERLYVTDAAGACPSPPGAPGPPGTGRVEAAHPAQSRAAASPWYALRLRANRETQVFGALDALGIEAFLPVWLERVQWSDRQMTVKRPLFPGYIFIRPASSDELRVALMTRGVVQILPNSFNPAAVDETEIETVQRVVASKLPAAPCEFTPCDFAPGEMVTIDSGPMAGVSGVVIRTKGSMRVVVSVELLRRSISVELGAETLIKKAVAPCS